MTTADLPLFAPCQAHSATSRAAAEWRHRRRLNLIGQRFGMLTVVGEGRKPCGRAAWVCQCDCGKSSITSSWLLMNGKTKSCGCQQCAKIRGHRNITHGKKHTKVYRVWSRMKERCLWPGNKCYHYYGGRGIKVCERWMVFEAFYADMGDPPSGYSIERIDVNGNYEPSNCKWIPLRDQYLNRTDTRLLTAFGETKPAVSWLKDSRCLATRASIYKRLENGWSHERAISEPMHNTRKAA